MEYLRQDQAWREYTDEKKLEDYPDRYHDFHFSVLQILPKTLTSDEVIETESLWKSKLLTREFGMNEN